MKSFFDPIFLLGFLCAFSCASVFAQSPITLSPIEDAFVRNGTYAGTNFGSDINLIVKGTTSSGFARVSYLKFQLAGVSNVVSAKLRVYGSNTESATTVNMSVYGVSDSWTEGGITFNNAPAASGSALSSAGVNNVAQYYDLDVTGFVQTQFSGDKVASFLLKDPTNQVKTLTLNSRENASNRPQLVITTSGSAPASNSLLFVENLDKFPSNDHPVASRIQIPWTRDSMPPYIYNANHDTIRLRIHNKGIDPLVISNLILSNTSNWMFSKLNGATYTPSALPLTINSGASADLYLLFIAKDLATRVAIVVNNLTIISNDKKTPSKTVFLHGIYQKQGEGSHEPRAVEVINAFNFKSDPGFTYKDLDLGDPKKPKGDEIISAYFVRADPSIPITVRQMSAYHGCCDNIYTEYLRVFNKGTNPTVDPAPALVTQIGIDAQTSLPRRATPNLPSENTNYNPTTAFGFKVGKRDHTDTIYNPSRKIGIRVWKAKDANGRLIPNAYIVSNDYLGTQFTNYDYNDNTYFVTNIRPEVGTANFSALSATPSAVDFGEKLLQSTNSFTLNLKSLGQTYANGSKDPNIVISSVSVVGDNSGEFSASLPAATTLGPQATTTLTVGFKPVSEGLKIADLLIYHNNSPTPLRVPLYGIGKASGTTVTVPFRIKSGSSSSVTVNGKTWVSDVPYAFDNLEPFTNSRLTQISATDEDVLYLREQSSDADKRPFRYEIPIANGTYAVRLHFAEIFWGNPGSGFIGGAGSRVMSVNIEGQLKLINFDVAQEVGSASAIIKNIPVTVSDGKLNINFSATVNRPMVCAVEVYQFSSGASVTQAISDVIEMNNDLAKPKVYPNPARDKFKIEFPTGYEGNANLEISDQLGRVNEIGAYHIQKGGTTVEINLSRFQLKQGIYYLKIISENRNTEVIKLQLE
ncbi:DNRLRE domain-containing protein [Chitinophagaceae bacterium LB-8]|uniref:DNRLRE domain-containing protein n=1 Tax=Paraflavisolibacter caeni TaxID=2982496 RepID=A0A9X3BGS1_9BACT|nr:DNRLRE domain-containing protein [Paraflavisolibacter caeni]MCU7548257.1 DNRLRE domain-containing protein [Paraflavisolibacter caeni]